MNINLLREKLMYAARSESPSDRVPYAFEKRIGALIQSEPLIDNVSLWVKALWRGAIPCLSVMLLFFAWTAATPKQLDSTVSSSLGADLESTLMASVTIENNLSW